jgi:hypothetical protein
VLTLEDFRRIALSLPEAAESSHMGRGDLRVRGKIFATLWPETNCGMVKLTTEEQALLVEAEPAVFAPVPGGWGRMGATFVTLAACDDATARDALARAWRRAAPKRLLAATGG